jgi:hypothetical protein
VMVTATKGLLIMRSSVKFVSSELLRWNSVNVHGRPESKAYYSVCYVSYIKLIA